MDITPLIPTGLQFIETYGEGRFRVSGAAYEGSVLVLPEQTLAWPLTTIEQLDQECLNPVIAAGGGSIDLLLLGCGQRAAMVPPGLRQVLRDAGVVIEAMGTGAACRTYNVLLTEGRRVAAALIAVER